ncbi:MAG: serine/threonine protein kinase [Kiritimatiellae bacterium]|nr:serine/threonine protein kinase [Kiritimatiellia bacterium]
MSEQLIKTPGTFGENGNFLLERELGSGGMGGVYMGRDKMLDRPVAVKVMLRELGNDPDFVEKFKREAQSVARLIHPNIAQVYSYGICDGMPYIAMELASGGSLYSIMNANPGKSDIPRVIKICQQVAQALQCASDQGCVHGDVKPENVLLDANGNAKLVDFGLAAMQKDTNEIWGTPYYISPEKVKKEPIDFRADMYSLGGTLYHALTGVAPFEGDDSIAVVKRRFEGPPKKPSELRPEITPAIDALVMKMLAFKKEDRHPSFEALLEAFKEVLSTGLTRKEPRPSIGGTQKSPASAATPGRRAMMRRRAMIRPGAAATSIKKTLPGNTPLRHAAAAKAVSDSGDEEEEGGGSLAMKVVGVVVGVVVLIGAVVGGLVWYQVADRKAREAEHQSQIVGGIAKARSAISDTLSSAAKFADEFDAFAQKAFDEVKKPTAELSKILPAEEAALLKPAPSKELLDAIAATNPAPPAAAAPAAQPAAPTEAAATNQPPAAAGADAKDAAKADAKDEKKDGAKEEKAEERKDAPAEEKDAKPAPPSQAVITMNELWNRAYGCQASAIRIRHAVRKIIEKGKEADALTEETKEVVDSLAGLSRDLVEMFEQVKISKDVENVRKGISFIKSKGATTVQQTTKRLRIEKLEAERKAKAESAAAAEKERQEKLAAEKKEKIEAETKAAADKFEMITSQGCLRQLDWKSAIRQLEALKGELATPEGQLAADLEIKKVNNMKSVQDIFVKNLGGHVFKGKLKGAKVTSVNDKEIQLVRPDNAKAKIPWQKFYKAYPGNLNEIINLFIVNARSPSARHRLNLRDWADAMTGAALTMKLVCAEVNGAVERSEVLAKEVVKQFPDYAKTTQKMFPEIKFEKPESSDE